jgi:hypothetical protein
VTFCLVPASGWSHNAKMSARIARAPGIISRGTANAPTPTPTATCAAVHTLAMAVGLVHLRVECGAACKYLLMALMQSECRRREKSVSKSVEDV